MCTTNVKKIKNKAKKSNKIYLIKIKNMIILVYTEWGLELFILFILF